MKKLILLLSLLSSLKLMAQPFKEVSHTIEGGSYRETFTVLKSDKKIKHGPYRVSTRERQCMAGI
jgi:hypothetical protein